MNVLLIFFALPIATIILAVVLQKILKCSLLVAATFFAIYLIVAFVLSPSGTLLIYVILYSILAYVTAVLTNLTCRIKSRFGNIFTNNNCVCNNENTASTISGNIRIIPSNCENENNQVTTVTTTTGSGTLSTTSNTYLNGRNTGCTCGRVCRRR